MQFRSVLLLAAMALVVAAPETYKAPEPEHHEGGYAPATTGGYEHHEGGYSDGYKKPEFAAPSLWDRIKAKFHHWGEKLEHLCGEFAESWHRHMVNAKSDLERIAWWFHCKREHFHVWWKFKCEVEAGKRKIRNEYERQIYDSMCKFQKEEKDKYEARVKECHDSGEDYTDEAVTKYVDTYGDHAKKY